MAAWDFDDFRILAADLTAAGAKAEPLAQLVIDKTASDLEAGTKRMITAVDAVDTGFMLNSVSTTRGRLEAEVGPTAHYAIYVHEGTSRMPGRPFLFPVLEELTPAFEQAMGQVIDRSLS